MMDKEKLEIGNRMVREIDTLEGKLRRLKALKEHEGDMELVIYPCYQEVDRYWISDDKTIQEVVDKLIHDVSTELTKLRHDFGRL